MVAGVGLLSAVVVLPLAALDTGAARADRSRSTVGAVAVPTVTRAARTVARHVPTAIDFVPRYAPDNPFDPDEVVSRLVTRAPDGSLRVYLAFWYEPYRRELIGGYEHLTASGDPYWQVRITPDLVGRWTWYLEGRDPLGEWRTPTRTLDVVESSLPGSLRRSPHSDRYLAFDDGSPYFAIGENLGWYDGRGTVAYDQWLRELGEAGGNFARFWMASWSFGIEWNDTGLGDYSGRLDRAWQLDHAIDTARVNGIQVELALLNHGAFSTNFNSEWASNPYNAANGGPLRRPHDFFTDERAKAWFRQRLMYIVARWGYAPNLLAWEFWNEVDLTDDYLANSAAVAGWHREMADVVRVLDPHRHLISSSTAIFGNEPRLWAEGGLDFAQVHHYARIGDIPYAPNLFRTIPEFTDIRRSQAPTLPVLFAELGVDSRGPVETRAIDPTGIGLHDGLWAGVVSGGFGTAMPWWWDSITHPEWDRYRPMFRAVARFVHGVRFDREAFAATTVDAGGTAPEGVSARVMVGRTRVLGWVKDEQFQWNAQATRPINGATVELQLPPGRWCGRWIDTWTGTGQGRIRTNGGATSLVAPRFARDLAFRLRAC